MLPIVFQALGADLKSLLLALSLCLVVAGANAQPAADPAVKKSRQNICHERGSRFYEQTKNYEPFDSMEACLDAGGRRVGTTREVQEPQEPPQEQSWWEKLVGGSSKVLLVIAGLSTCTVAFLLSLLTKWSPLRKWRERRRLRLNEANARRKWENHRRE